MKAQKATELTVRDALKLDVFQSATVIAGESGLDRVIERVSVLDAPDIAAWLKGKELILTNAYVLKVNPDNQQQLIQSLIDKDCSALAIKLGRYILAIPPEILELGDKMAFPIISLSFEVFWTEIINSVLSQILNQKYYLLQQSELIRDQYTSQILAGGGYDGICSTLSQSLAAPVAICDSYGELLCNYSPEGGAFADIDLNKVVANYQSEHGHQVVEKNLKKQHEKANLHVLPIVIENRVYGFLILLYPKNKIQYLEKQIIHHSSTAIALEMLRHKTNLYTENQIKKQFVEDLLRHKYKSLESVRATALSHGWNLEANITAVVLKVLNNEDKYAWEKNEDLFNHILQYCSTRKYTYAVNRTSDTLVFISSSRNDESAIIKEVSQMMEQLNQRSSLNFQYKVGVGNTYTDIPTETYQQAIDALDIGRKLFPENQLYHIKDLLIYRVIWNHSNKDDLDNLVKLYLARVIDHDQNNSLKLLDTLEVYISKRGNTRQAAEALHIHNNTLLYRLNKISKLLNANLDDPETLFNLDVALRTYQLKFKTKENGK